MAGTEPALMTLFGILGLRRRVVGSREIMREQLEHLHALSTEPHITVEVLPHSAGAHPGLTGQLSLLEFSDTREAVVSLERFTSDLCLTKTSDVRQHSGMHARLRAPALAPSRAGTSSLTPSSSTHPEPGRRRAGLSRRPEPPLGPYATAAPPPRFRPGRHARSAELLIRPDRRTSVFTSGRFHGQLCGAASRELIKHPPSGDVPDDRRRKAAYFHHGQG